MAGGGGHEAACAGYATGQTVEMYDSCFSGSAQFVRAGSTVQIVNRGDLPHSLTAVDGSFGTDTLQPGQSASIEVGDAAVVRVFCELHGTRQGEGMAGLLVVGEPTATMAGSDLVSADLETSGDELPTADPSPEVAAVPAGEGRPLRAGDSGHRRRRGCPGRGGDVARDRHRAEAWTGIGSAIR